MRRRREDVHPVPRRSEVNLIGEDGMGEGGRTIDWADFEKVQMRVGRVERAEPFPQARKPAIKLWIDFGPELGIRKSSAQLTVHYTPESLVGRRVIAVTNFPPRQIGPVMSEVLVLGVPDENGAVVLLHPDQDVPLGGRVF
jgi:tRNA-binding protein